MSHGLIVIFLSLTFTIEESYLEQPGVKIPWLLYLCYIYMEVSRVGIGETRVVRRSFLPGDVSSRCFKVILGL